jgi:conjugative transfer signal peptidase TraF
VPILPKFVLWNASASVPPGLYLLRSPYPLHSNELVVATPPAPLAKFLAARGYLPAGVPLLKHVAALRGQTVCRVAHTITIDGHAIAFARDDDHRGRLLPAWKGCRTLRAGEVFLLNPNIPDSFDGRYFGPLSAAAITARAEPLWIIGKD